MKDEPVEVWINPYAAPQTPVETEADDDPRLTAQIGMWIGVIAVAVNVVFVVLSAYGRHHPLAIGVHAIFVALAAAYATCWWCRLKFED